MCVNNMCATKKARSYGRARLKRDLLEKEDLFFGFTSLRILFVLEFGLYIIICLPCVITFSFDPALAVGFLAGLRGGVQAVDVGRHVAVGLQVLGELLGRPAVAGLGVEGRQRRGMNGFSSGRG